MATLQQQIDDLRKVQESQAKEIRGLKDEIYGFSVKIVYQEMRLDDYWRKHLAIRKAVCDKSGVTVEQLRGTLKGRKICDARFVHALLLRESKNPEFSYPHMARLIGRKDHCTVINQVRRATELLTADPHFAAMVKDVRKTIQQNGG